MDSARDEQPVVETDSEIPCGAGFTKCSGRCVLLASNNNHCGACDNVCMGEQTCVAGACKCPAGQELCGARCVTLSSDTANCGMCGRACTSAEVCSMGTCGTTCAGAMCGASCVNLQTDPANCGACGMRCSAPTGGSATCVAGSCVSTCPAGESACSGVCVNRNTDLANCGMCGRVCMLSVVGATPSCTMGTCGGGCPAGQRTCMGACVSTMANDISACGPSCTRCTAPANGTATCNGMTCGFTCNTGFMMSGSSCVAMVSSTCGNGTLDASETCDDGNMAPGDGCSATCMVENIFSPGCNTAPAVRIRTTLGVRQFYRGTTTGASLSNNGSMRCSAEGPDLAIEIGSAVGGNLTVAVVPDGWDAVLLSCENREICSDRSDPTAREFLTFRVGAGTMGRMQIDGYRANSHGPFVLEVSLAP